MRIRRRHGVLTAATLALGFLPGCAGDTGNPTSSPPLPAASLSGRPGGWHGTMVDKPALATPPGTFRTTAGQVYRFTRPVRDEVTVVFFGFTHCDDVCPTTMADLAAARRSLRPSIAEGLHVVFVTVDQKRDTPAVLHRWLTRYDQSFVGLRGSEATVHAAERSLYAPVSGISSPSDSPQPDHHRGDDSHHSGSGYQVDHTGSVYVFGPGGRTLVYTGGTSPAEYAADFRRLLPAS